MHNPRLARIPVKAVPVQAGDGDSAAQQVSKFYARLKHTIPFPVPMMDVYRPLIPNIKLTKPLIGGEKVDIPYFNLGNSVMWGHTVHVSMDPYDEYVKAYQGYEEFGYVFHMTFVEEIVVPDIMTHPYFMDDSHPHWMAVKEWATAAWELEGKLNRQLGMLSTYLRAANSAAAIRKTWPELLNFIKLQGPTLAHISEPTIRKLIETVPLLRDAKTKKQVLENLAAATLLDVDKDPAAWISFKTP